MLFRSPRDHPPVDTGAPPAASPVLSGELAPRATPGPDGVPGGVGPQAGPGSPGSWMVDTPHGRVLRAGAVIGMPPPSGSSPDGMAAPRPGPRPGGRSPSSSSSSAASGEPAGAGERGPGGMLGGLGGAGMRSGQDRRGRRSEPYVEWEVPKGVPPVLEPGPEPTHDPGPGAIGIDR